MKMLTLSLVTLLVSVEAFAQRGPRYNPPGNGSSSSSSRTTVVVRDSHHHSSPSRVYVEPRVVGPRYNPPGPISGPVIYRDSYSTYRDPYSYSRVAPRTIYRQYSTRYIRTIPRPAPIWTYGFGYSCGYYGDLTLNGRPIHNFAYSSDCQQAIQDIQIYGDFCDNADMIDQTGYLEAAFSSNWECRDALPYYY